MQNWNVFPFGKGVLLTQQLGCNFLSLSGFFIFARFSEESIKSAPDLYFSASPLFFPSSWPMTTVCWKNCATYVGTTCTVDLPFGKRRFSRGPRVCTSKDVIVPTYWKAFLDLGDFSLKTADFIKSKVDYCTLPRNVRCFDGLRHFFFHVVHTSLSTGIGVCAVNGLGGYYWIFGRDELTLVPPSPLVLRKC